MKWIALLLLALALPVRAQTGIELAITPASQTVAPNDQVTLYLVIPTQADQEFNTYGLDVTVTGGLTIVDVKEGTHMPSVCSNTYYVYTPSTDHVTHSLLCAQTFTTGPGQLLEIVVDADGSGTVGLANVAFYRAGYPAAVGTITGASITVSSGGGGGGCHPNCGIDPKAQASSPWSQVKGLYRP